VANVVINQLFKFTELQTVMVSITWALVKGRPRIMNLKNKSANLLNSGMKWWCGEPGFELREAEKKAHILQGYLIALDHLDEVIRLIRASATPDVARDALVNAGGA
jgi:DNA gyrase subunit A